MRPLSRICCVSPFAGLAALTIALAASTANAASAWATFGGNAQHTGLSASPSQPLSRVRWSTPVDLSSPGEPVLVHYGSPLITAANTVIIPVKTSADGAFRLDARKGRDGSLVWSTTTDYVAPPHGFFPSYSPALTSAGRVWFPGAGGTMVFRDGPDTSPPTATGKVAFYGLAAYQANPASFDSTVFVNTPITVAASGSIYFGFRTVAGAPLGLSSGIAKIDAAGNGTWIAASTIAGDPAVTMVPHQAAPALGNDESTLYVAVADEFGDSPYLVGLEPSTLAVKNVSPGIPMRVKLKDPRGNGNNAFVSDNSTASPMVGPDGDVYYGVFGNPYNGSRGWLLHYSANLQQTKLAGAFGWDTTPAVVPRAMIPSYTGPSSYLLFNKYNDYAGDDGGTGINQIAVLDPNDSMPEPHPSSAGLAVMKAVLAIAGPTPDEDVVLFYPEAVKEWCINAAAVDPATKSVMVNSEDGKLYRWDLSTNTLSQSIRLSEGLGEAYTSTLIGPDGTVYATNKAILHAVNASVVINVTRNGSGSGSVTSNAGGIACGATCSGDFAPSQSVTLTAVADPGSVFTGWLGACTGRATCQVTAQSDATVTATFAPSSIAPLGFDVDGNHSYDALTDALIAIRYLFGLTGTALISGALGNGASRTTPAQVTAYLNDTRPLFDIDGNGRADALTDGLMLVRYLFGLRGAPLIAGTIGAGAARTTAAGIESYIQSLLP